MTDRDNILPELTDPQAALNEIIDHILGDGWYVVMPMCQKQVNTIAVAEIKATVKEHKKRRFFNIF